MKYTGKSAKLTATEAYNERSNFYHNIVANTGDNAYDDAYALRDESM